MLKQVTLTIPERLYDDAAIIAKQTNSPLEELLVDAIDLSKLQSRLVVDLSEADEALEREQEAYIQMHQKLKEQYLGVSVAVHGGQLVDTDTDYGALYERIMANYPMKSVWLTTVKEEATPTLMMRSPRFSLEN